MGDFVRKQRAIPVNELSKDDTECFCCSTTYGQLQAEGLIEYAVKLECSHILGSICLTRWLQYSNTCPHCRKQLFPQTHQTHKDESDLVEMTIGEVEDGLLAGFEQHREPTEDEVDEVEATGRSGTWNHGTNDDEQATQSWRAAAVRRRSDMHTRNLYDDVRIDQIQTGILRDDILPALEPWELIGGVLGWEPDRALFRHLQTVGAFSIPGMESDRRTPPNISDEAFYEQLRTNCVRYIPERHGWFRYGKRVFFGGIQPELAFNELEFDRLSEQGAFRTIGITRSFRDVDNLFPGEDTLTPTDYEIFQTTRDDSAHFHADERCWYNDQHDQLYGDVPSDPSTRSERIWKDRRTSNLSAEAGADGGILDYVDNLWISNSR